MKRILFVCTGNICRSPTAEAVARHYVETAGLAERFELDSAGTSGYHVGELPDPRTRRAAARRGYDLSTLVARRLEPADFQQFDLLLAMDRSHYEAMLNMCAPVYRPKVELFMRFARDAEFDEVPDPYYGGEAGFEAVLDMCEEAVKGLFETLQLQR